MQMYNTRQPASVGDGVRKIVNINSRDRVGVASSVAGNLIAQLPTSTPSSYVVPFAQLVRVRSIELISSEVTNSRYLIDETNNMFDIVSSAAPAGTFTVTLTPGNYGATDLEIELDTQINAALGVAPGAIIVVVYTPSTSKYSFTRVDGSTFNLLLATGENARYAPLVEVGFAAVDTGLVASYIAPNVANLSGDDYALLCIQGMGIVLDSGGRSDCFAKHVWSVPARYATYNSFVSSRLEWNPPLPRLDRLVVSWFRPNGQPYNFNGVDHSFSVAVTCD